MAEEPFWVIDVDGTYDSKVEPRIDADVLRRAYRTLVLVRALDARMLSLQRQGRIGFYVPSTGEEASQIGSAILRSGRRWEPAERQATASRGDAETRG